MTHPSRFRRIVKRTGVALMLVIAAAWGVSLGYIGAVPLGNMASLGITRGYAVLIVNHRPPYQWPVAFFNSRTPTSHGFGLPTIQYFDTRYGGSWHSFGLPLWQIFLIVAIPTAYLYYLDRRTPLPPGHCSKCRYNLTGNTSGRCPECGTTTLTSTSVTI